MRKIKLKESDLIRLVKKTINEKRRERDVEAVTEKVVVCVKGGCYDWNKTSDSIQCSSHGGDYECFDSVRKCKNNC